MRIEHVGLYARDPQALAEWYERCVGLRVIRRLEKEGRPPIFFLAGEGDGQIEVLPTDAPRIDREIASPGLSHVGLVVDSFDEVQRRLEDVGVALTGIRETSKGWKIGYLTDPEGNTLEIVHRP